MTDLQTIRENLQQQREATARAKLSLESARQSIPIPTAKLLRQGTFSGLPGRQRLQGIEKVKGAIEEQSENIRQYEGQLGEYETQINQAEQQQRAAEAAAEAQQAQARYALQVYLGQVSGGDIGSVPKNIQDWARATAERLEPHYDSAKVMANFVSKWEAANPTEHIVLDRSGTQIAGITSGALGMSLQGTTEYNKMIADINKKVADVSIPAYKTDISYRTPLSTEMFTLVSANPTTYVPPQGTFMPSPSFQESRTMFLKREIAEKGSIGGILSVFAQDIGGGISKVEQLIGVKGQSLGEATTKFIEAPITLYQGVKEIPREIEKLNVDAGKLVTGVSAREYNQAANRYKELEVNIKNWEKYSKPDESGKPVFTGTEEQYAEYLKDVNEYEKNRNIISKTVNIGGMRGLGYKGREESIQKYKGLYSETGNPLFIDIPSRTSALISVGGGAVASVVGESFSRAYNALTGGNIFFKEQVVPEGKYTSLGSYQGGTMQYDVLTGKPIVWKETTVPSYTLPAITSEQIGEGIYEAGSSFFDAGKYALPYAGVAFAVAEVGGRLQEYKYNPIEFAKENPTEAALTGLAIVGLIGWKVGKKVFTPVLTAADEKAPMELLKLGGKGKGRNVMSKISYEVSEGGTTTILRGFEGSGVGESASAGRRIIFQSPFQKFFRLKPTYSGNIYGETLVYAERKGLPYLKEKVLTITKAEASQGYKKVLKAMEKRFTPFGEEVTKKITAKAARYIRRYKPSYEVTKVDYKGVMGTKFAKEPLTRIGIAGTRKEIPVKQPIIVDSGEGFQALSFSKGGKTKVFDVTSGLEELKTIIPKGAEAEGLGELTLFKGGSKEFNPLGKLGKKIREYKEVATAKKTGEISFGEEEQLGNIEFYKTGSVSKEITYGKKIPKVKRNTLGEFQTQELNPLKTKLDEFRNTLSKFEQVKFNKLQVGSKITWMEQVEAKIPAPNIKYRGEPISKVDARKLPIDRLEKEGYVSLYKKGLLNRIEIGKSLDKGYSYLAKKGMLKKIKPYKKIGDYYEYPSTNKIPKVFDILEETKLPKGMSKEVTDIQVINPAIRTEVKLNYEEGIFGVEKFGITPEGKWGLISKVEVPVGVREFKGLDVSAKIKKTPLSKTFGEQPKPILETPKPILQGKLIAEETSKLFKVSKKVKIKESIKLSSQEEYLPLMVGGGGKGISLYAGTGQYEVQELGAVTMNVPLQKTFLEVKPAQENLLFTGQQFKQPQLEILKTDMKMNEMLKVQERLKLNERVKVEERLKMDERLKMEERLKLNEMLKLNERLKMEERLKMLQRMKQPQKERLKQPQPPTKPPFKFKIPESTPSKIDLGLVKSAFGKIKAFGRRFGKDILLGEFKTETEATKKLRGFLTGTLSASGYLEKGGKKLKVNLGQGFRPSKKEPLRVVQLKESRLSARPETKEIQSERRKNKGVWKI